MSDDDLIRRSDAEAAIVKIRDAERNVGEDARSGWDAYKIAAVHCRQAVAALPADPVAAAAVALADLTIDPIRVSAIDGTRTCIYCDGFEREGRPFWHVPGACAWDAYRAAVAARGK